MGFEAVIGLEIHAQLSTATKIFCGCSTAAGASANTHVCQVCLGYPGVLPVLNHAAVDLAATAALALGCDLHPVSIFARKNYFYPDLPKGYQISQYDRPIATGGALVVDSGAGPVRVGITRIHMEEDAGKSVHDAADADRKTSLDFNRSGVPLIEIVSEPDLRTAADAAAYFEALRTLLTWIGVNDGNMEEGSLRCDANVSVRPRGTEAFGTKVEVKNLNSFRFLQKAIEFEVDRQVEVIEAGGRVAQETRLFDSATGVTVSMRSKEDAHDYRYFPDPDLPPVVLSPERLARIRSAMPELPDARRARFVADFGLPAYDAAQLTQQKALADLFEATVAAGAAPKPVSNWLMGEWTRLLKDRDLTVEASPVQDAALAGLLALIDAGTINTATAKGVLEQMFATGRSAAAIVEAQGLAQIDDDALVEGFIAAVLAEHADAVASYRSGKAASFGFLVGQVMKRAAGKANPARVTALLTRALAP